VKLSAAIALIHPLDHLLAPLALEVDVDVGRLTPLGRDEPLEQKAAAHRVDRSDAQHVADGGVGGRAPPLAQDVLAPGKAHDAVQSEEDGEPALAVNRYFVEHPHMVLGLHGRTTSPFGVVYTCRYCPSVSLEADLGAALERLPRGIHTPSASPESTPVRQPGGPRIKVGTAAEGATVKEGSYFVLDGMLTQVIDGVPRRVAVKSAAVKEGIFAKHAHIIQSLLPVRDAVRAVLRAQEANEPWGMLQGRLRTAYQSFVRQFGPINLTTVSTGMDPKTGEAREMVRRPNLSPFLDDPDVWLVSSIEQYDEESGTAKMGPIFLGGCEF